ncbi:hypothetical protein HO173_000503 [Letharia columbiana]|uniref:Filamentation protein n=1 Tax=Letharia columbiana TaxID=112416 RepID=A0A8H6G784_9LECA|nr:uncharacterized protein HO173_000503 [Letharia columbiana]KAF6241791.1 hypothetical protein HO173_000503 [Letharia columbiana]
MLSQREPDKARHYLDLLDAARCDGHWQEITELTRKVGKHAPQRKCLILTAQTERRIAEVSGRPITSSSATALSQLIPPLQAATEKEKAFNEDAFQAQICLGWIHSTVGDPTLALSILPPTFDRVSDRLSRDGGITARWTQVCIIKGAYLRGLSLEETNSLGEAIRTYESMLPYITSLPSTFANTPENRYWTESLLTRHCMLSSRHVSANQVSPSILAVPPSRVLAPFRAYSKYWDTKSALITGTLFKAGDRHNSYMRTWGHYYDTLSILLQRETTQHVFDSRLQQGVELKKVEATYESILLKETSFPRADEANSQIESWVDQVMANWGVMCGHTWQDEELGEGGKAALGRGVLDVLYRAATKSFHSTRVLRHLFIVHAAIAEFDVATKALDSYLQILVKGKARVENSGEPEIGLDDDETSLATAAAGIKMLCTYGRRKEAKRALGIAHVTENWLQRLHSTSSPKPVVSGEDVPEDLVDQQKPSRPPVSGKALALGYHALGISQSCWARLTYETASRPDLQAKAIADFRIALDPEFGEERNVEFLYSLAFVLAETRDLDGAIAATKQALSASSRGPNTNGVSATDFAGDSVEDGSDFDPDRRGLLLRCWHLLALLLSARQNFSTAIASCEAALEIYGGKAILYGDLKLLDSLKDLEWSERKNIIEVKMTQLALAEVVDGPEEAVNASGELLGLYTKLFKSPDKPLERVISSPANTNGTSTPRSFRASVLGLPSRKNTGRVENTNSSSLPSSEATDQAIQAPTISVTSDTASTLQDSNHHSHFLGRHESKKLRKRNSRKSMGSIRKGRAASPPRTSTADGSRKRISLGLPTRHRHNKTTPADGHGDGSVYEDGSYASDEVGVAISHDMPSMPSSPAAVSDPPNPLHFIPSATANMDKKNPNTYPVAPKPPPSQRQRPQPITLHKFPPLAEPQFSPADQSRHTLTLLTKIWLLIASLYRRASMPTDAQGALSEATTHVQSIETFISKREGSSAENFAMPGYGGVKSCGELWADVLAERAALHTSLGNVDQASAAYETALGHFPDHAAATVGLCNILLDAYSAPPPTVTPAIPIEPPPSTPTLASLPPLPSQQINITTHNNSDSTTTPDRLSRLAARDRAYGLLSALTKSGTGWDNSEAWFALARAYEEGGQVEKAKESLWWVVELEEGRGVRRWGNIV